MGSVSSFVPQKPPQQQGVRDELRGWRDEDGRGSGAVPDRILSAGLLRRTGVVGVVGELEERRCPAAVVCPGVWKLPIGTFVKGLCCTLPRCVPCLTCALEEAR